MRRRHGDAGLHSLSTCGNGATARRRGLFPRCASCGNAGPVQAVALRLKINPRRTVDTKISVLEDGALTRRGIRKVARTAQGRADTRLELAYRKRLSEIVISPRVERIDLIGVFVSGGHHDDRHLGPYAYSANDLDAVDIGKPQVEQNHIGRIRGGRSDGASPRRLGKKIETLSFKRREHQVSNHSVILDNKDLCMALNRHDLYLHSPYDARAA